MNEQENILRLIEAAGPIAQTPFPEWCARFAALVRADAVAETREACAKVCDSAAHQSAEVSKHLVVSGETGPSLVAAGGEQQAKKLSEFFRSMAATPSREGKS